MPIRLLRPKRDGHWTEPTDERPAPAEVGPRISQRQFLKTVAAAVGLAGAAELAQVVTPAPAFADELVSGNLYVASGNMATIGASSPPWSASTFNVVTTKADDGIALLGSTANPPNQNLWIGTNATAGAINGIVRSGDRGIVYGGSSAGHPNGGLVIAPWRNDTSGMRLGPEGKVGIWTTANPVAPLDVNGFIAANDGADAIAILPPLLNQNWGWKIGLWANVYAIGATAGTIAMLVGQSGYVSMFDTDYMPMGNAMGRPTPRPDGNAAVSLGTNGDGYFKGNVGIGATLPSPIPAALYLAGGQFRIGSTVIADSNGAYYAP